MGRRQVGWLAWRTLVALVGRRRWRRTGRRHMAILRRLRLRFLCPVGTRLWVGKRLRLSVWRLRLLVTPRYVAVALLKRRAGGTALVELCGSKQSPHSFDRGRL